MTRGDEHEGLLGRDAELAAIDAAIGRVAGSPALALIGEAGIGKSAVLTAAAARAAAADLTVLAGRAAEHEQDVPFGLVADALDDTVAELHDRRLESLGPERLADLAGVLPSAAGHADAPQAPGAAERFRYHRALAALLAMLARERPVALLLDDLHWADEGSVEFVLHLLRRPPEGVLLLFALRPVEPAPRLLDALRGARDGTLLQLQPLERAAALELLAGVDDAALRERLEREAGGNPLFLKELARVAPAPGEPLPPTLLAAVQLEAAALPPASRALIEGAAVAGDPFDLDLAVAAADLDPADATAPLDRLVAADLVHLADGRRRFRFRHPLVRRAVYDTAPAGWRLAAHERIDAALAARGASATARAFHVEQYARPGDEAALQVLADAAGASFDTAPAAAARWYEAALALVPEVDRDRRMGLLAPRALALASAGRFEESRAAILQALDVLGADGALELRVLLVLGCAEVEQVLGRHREARTRLLDAYEALPQDAPLRVRLEVQLASTAGFTLDREELTRWAELAVGHLGDARSALALGAWAIASFAASFDGRPERAADACAHAETLLGEVDDAELAAYPEAPLMLANAQLSSGRFAGCVASAERGLAVSRAFRQDRLLVPLHIFAAMGRWNLAEPDAALEHLDAAEEGARLAQVPQLLSWTLWMRVQTQRIRGDQADIARVLPEARELTDSLPPSVPNSSGRCNLVAFDPRASPERRLTEIVEAGGGLDLPRVDPVWGTALMRDLCRAALEADRADEARGWADRADEVARALGQRLPRLRAAGARVEVLLADDEAAAAAELAKRTVADAEAAGATLEALSARVRAGRALAAAGRRDEAVATLQVVAERAGAGGAGLLVEEAAAELRRLGTRPSAAAGRAGAGTGIEALTEREREIAELVAQGLPNKQVAAAVFLSEKTVEHHLSRIYAKAGVRGRVELTALMGGG